MVRFLLSFADGAAALPRPLFQPDRDVMQHVLRRWFLLLGVALVVPVLVARSATAQAPDDLPLARLESAFRSGDVHAIMASAADRLEMAVMSSGMLYSRGQAVYVMDRFFREHPPQRFTLVDVAEADETWFATGHYLARGEERRHNVYLRLQRTAGAWQLVEIRISVGGGP